MESRIGLKVPKELRDRIEKYAEDYRRDTGHELTFSAAIRVLIARGLLELAGDEG